MLETISVLYFSPTGGTKRAAFSLAEGLAEQSRKIDLSLPETKTYTFEKEETVLFAVPVFGGRIPAYLQDKLKNIKGNGTKAITVAVYGNRAYDDALLELNDSVKAQGFQIIASAALLAEHSMYRAIAEGRPDKQDLSQIKEYAAKMIDKIENQTFHAEPSVPGKRPYVQWQPMPVVPIVSDACTVCGSCAIHCPTQAIEEKEPQKTEPSKCMLCMRCIAVCPKQARSLPPNAQAMITQKLSPLKNIRRENELFL